jgi:hypothetical protein
MIDHETAAARTKRMDGADALMASHDEEQADAQCDARLTHPKTLDGILCDINADDEQDPERFDGMS